MRIKSYSKYDEIEERRIELKILILKQYTCCKLNVTFVSNNLQGSIMCWKIRYIMNTWVYNI